MYIELPIEIASVLNASNLSSNDANILNNYFQEHKIRNVTKEEPYVSISHSINRSELETTINSHRRFLILSLTNKCNMDCTYCVYHDKFNTRSFTNQTMPFSIAKKAIDEIFDYSSNVDTIHFGFYGGECLVEFDLLKDCVEYIRSISNGVPVSFGTTTNGLLLNNKKYREFLTKNDFSVVVSLDGPLEINDIYRKDKNGLGVFRRVIKNIKDWYTENSLFVEKHVIINAVKASGTSLKLLDDYFSNFPIRYTYGDLYETDYFRDNEINFENSYIKSLNDNLNYQYSNQFLNEHISSFKKYEMNMPCEIPNRILPGAPCIPVYIRLFVNTDGEYYPCEKVDEKMEYRIGCVENGVDIDRIIDLYNEYIRVSRIKCRGCWAFRLCGRCFKNISEDCDIHKENILNNMAFYISYLKNDKSSLRIMEDTIYSI